MEILLDELKQYDLKRIIDIKNISFKYEFTLCDKYYLYVQFHDNIIISLNIDRQVPKYNMHRIIQNKKKHLYEFEHNFEMQNIYDIFYNFCLNNFVNMSMQTTQLYMYLHTVCEINNIITCEICTINFTNSYKLLYESEKTTISNLNVLHLFYDTINKHEKSTVINIIFEKN